MESTFWTPLEVHDDKLCIPRQLAALTGIPMDDICANFDSICPEGWREEGVSLAELLEWCKQHERPFYYLHKGRLEVHLQDAPNPGVAFTTFDGHVYMYSSTRWVREFSTDAPAQSARLASDPKSKTPPWEEWAPYDGVKPGYFYTDDLFAVRRSLLETGRSPKVSLKDLHTHRPEVPVHQGG